MRAPTDHEVAAALAVARRVDIRGNDVATLISGLKHAATQGLWLFDDMHRAMGLLTAAGLLNIEGGTAVASEHLRTLTGLPDPEALPLLRQLLAARDGSNRMAASRAEVGAVAEVAVVDECRAQLDALGRSDLAGDVQRVSLISDMLGYDVTAPVIGGSARMLEVKGSTHFTGGVFEFYLSRNEFEVGTRSAGRWWLVACEVDASTAAVVGHCSANGVGAFLPRDDRGRWTEALVRMPSHLLTRGLPSALA